MTSDPGGGDAASTGDLREQQGGLLAHKEQKDDVEQSQEQVPQPLENRSKLQRQKAQSRKTFKFRKTRKDVRVVASWQQQQQRCVVDAKCLLR